MKILSYSEARSNLKQTMDAVCRDHAPIVITRHNEGSVVMLSLSDYNSITETLYLLSSEKNAARLRSSIDQIKAIRCGKEESETTKLDEEKRESFRQDSLASWEDHKETGLHVTGGEISAWLDTWGSENEGDAPVCHG